MKLIGFAFIESQEKFEQWQLEYPDYSIHQVMPHCVSMRVEQDSEKKYETGLDASTIWGVFVTYAYETEA